MGVSWITEALVGVPPPPPPLPAREAGYLYVAAVWVMILVAFGGIVWMSIEIVDQQAGRQLCKRSSTTSTSSSSSCMSQHNRTTINYGFSAEEVESICTWMVDSIVTPKNQEVKRQQTRRPLTRGEEDAPSKFSRHKDTLLRKKTTPPSPFYGAGISTSQPEYTSRTAPPLSLYDRLCDHSPDPTRRAETTDGAQKRFYGFYKTGGEQPYYSEIPANHVPESRRGPPPLPPPRHVGACPNETYTQASPPKRMWYHTKSA
jgi:hypothetical protein